MMANVQSAALDGLLSRLSKEQLQAFCGLNSPREIQAYLDATPYSTEDADRSPLSVMRDRVAHCLDGGLFAAAALRRLGYRPLIVDLLPEPGQDDDHVLAIYRRDGHFGALAKSNFAGLRSREPIYRSLRELVLSYFEFYFNTEQARTLRGYTVPLDLTTLDGLNWMWDDRAATAVEERLDRLRRFRLLTPDMVAELTPVDKLTYEAGSLGTNPAGVFRPKAKHGGQV